MYIREEGPEERESECKCMSEQKEGGECSYGARERG